MTNTEKRLEEFDEKKKFLLLQVFKSFQKHLGKYAKSCPDCGGTMYTICEKTMREMYAQGMDKTANYFATSIQALAEERERMRELIEKKLQEVTPLYTLGDLIIGSENMQADTILGQQKVLKDLLSSLDKPLTDKE